VREINQHIVHISADHEYQTGYTSFGKKKIETRNQTL